MIVACADREAGLQERTRAYMLEGRRVSYVESPARLTEWKRSGDHDFLSEVSSVPLQQALRHLQAGFANFAKKDAAGHWFVSPLVKETIRPLPPATANVGIDAGITAPATLSTGEKMVNPRHERADRREPAKAQRAPARKEKGSNDRAKAKVRAARVYARIIDRRRDHLHKITTRLVRENQVIAVEDLTVRTMVKNHSPARASSDASWRETRSMLEYKATWYVTAGPAES